MKKRAHAVRVGVGGWSFAPWRGRFYPKDLAQKGELEYASRKLTSIEINSTFYGPQKPATFAKWRDATPADFVFSVKGPRFVTNRRALAEAGDSIQRFLNGGVLQLGDKLGPINWQLAPTKQFDPQEIDAFLALLPAKVAGRAIRHAIEVRHASFDTPQFVALARKHAVAIVVAGDAKYPYIDAATAPFRYARIMGTKEGRPKGYTPAKLDSWAAQIREWSAEQDVFLYVISGYKESNPAAAMAVIERLQAR